MKDSSYDKNHVIPSYFDPFIPENTRSFCSPSIITDKKTKLDIPKSPQNLQLKSKDSEPGSEVKNTS